MPRRYHRSGRTAGLSGARAALATDPWPGAAANRLLVRTLRAASGDLDGKIDALSRADDANDVAPLAQHIKAVLAAHLTVK